MRTRFHRSARAEFIKAAQYYERCVEGLGAEFIEGIEECVAGIGQEPERWPIYVGNVRRRLVPRFPFAVLYEMRAGEVFVIAIAHTKRRPGYWKDRK